MTVKQRRLFIRLGIVVLWVALGALIFVLNRGHSLLLDNHDISEASRAPDLIKVTVDKNEPLEFFRGDRDIMVVGGSNHRIKIEFTDGSPPFHGTFRLPLLPDMFLLSIPKMIDGVEPFFEEFHSAPETREAED